MRHRASRVHVALPALNPPTSTCAADEPDSSRLRLGSRGAAGHRPRRGADLVSDEARGPADRPVIGAALRDPRAGAHPRTAPYASQDRRLARRRRTVEGDLECQRDAHVGTGAARWHLVRPIRALPRRGVPASPPSRQAHRRRLPLLGRPPRPRYPRTVALLQRPSRHRPQWRRHRDALGEPGDHPDDSAADRTADQTAGTRAATTERIVVTQQAFPGPRRWRSRRSGVDLLVGPLIDDADSRSSGTPPRRRAAARRAPCRSHGRSRRARTPPARRPRSRRAPRRRFVDLH